jgi:small subunit ribosomal protein S18
MAQDRERRKGKSAAADRRRVPKKKTSILTSERIDWIDYKDVNLLRRFMSERAEIRARRVTGNSQQQHRSRDGPLALQRPSGHATQQGRPS